MALMFPSRSACRFDSKGEERLAERLEKKLGEQPLCWSNVPVGPLAQQPDFVILHPLRGLLVIEVKDWSLATIQSINPNSAAICRHGKVEQVRNPLAQARDNAMALVNELKKDPALTFPAESHYQGKLAMPYGWGLVLTNITRKQFEETELAAALESRWIIFQDEMTESVDAEVFQKRFWNMFKYSFPCHLSDEQVSRIRYHLFPEVRVNHQSGQFGLFSQAQAPLPSLMRVMDLQQEQLARSLGDGHRIIHGVAGSGKTMILAYRAAYLAQATNKPVLVLCFNKSLAGRLRQVMNHRIKNGEIKVTSFHAWCRDLVKRHGLPLPPRGTPVAEAMKQLVSTALTGLEQKSIPHDQYSAVLIDEGHDFKADWFRIVVPLIDEATQSLLVLYDDAQAIYDDKGDVGRRNFSFASVGIQAKGRTTILRVNYRNTIQILSVAKAFARDLLAARDAVEDEVPVIAPESAGRQGDIPELIRCDSEQHEWACIIDRIRDAQHQGRALSDIAIIYRTNAQGERAERALEKAQLPFASARDNQSRGDLYKDSDEIKIVSMHSSKGLEFGLVLIPSLHEMPSKQETTEARLLYVAMTRAIDRLVMTYRSPTNFTEQLVSSIDEVRRHLG